MDRKKLVGPGAPAQNELGKSAGAIGAMIASVARQSLERGRYTYLGAAEAREIINE